MLVPVGKFSHSAQILYGHLAVSYNVQGTGDAGQGKDPFEQEHIRLVILDLKNAGRHFSVVLIGSSLFARDLKSNLSKTIKPNLDTHNGVKPSSRRTAPLLVESERIETVAIREAGYKTLGQFYTNQTPADRWFTP
jgi:hypothetical protein